MRIATVEKINESHICTHSRSGLMQMPRKREHICATHQLEDQVITVVCSAIYFLLPGQSRFPLNEYMNGLHLSSRQG